MAHAVLLIFPIGNFFPPVVYAIYNISLTLCCASQFIREKYEAGHWHVADLLLPERPLCRDMFTQVGRLDTTVDIAGGSLT